LRECDASQQECPGDQRGDTALPHITLPFDFLNSDL
jgi:hypothetical protein